MTLFASPVSSAFTSPSNAIAPLRFPANLRLTPDQFALLCAENRDAVLELAADGRVLAMTPTGKRSTVPVAFASPTTRCSAPTPL